MISGLIIVALVSFVFAGTSRRVSSVMRPRSAATVYACAAVLIAATSTGLLVVTGWYAAARLAPVAEVGGWSAVLLARTSPVPFPVALVAVALSMAIAVFVGELWVRRVHQLRRAYQMLAPTAADEITVVADSRVDAFAVDGSSKNRRIVITRGLLQELGDDALRQAVIEHERSHLRHHHLLYRIAVETAARANPLLRPVTGVVDEAIEAWADDDAAAATAPATVAAALAMVAITRAKPRTVRVTMGITRSATVQRVERLLTPSPATRFGVVPATVLALASGVVLAVCCRHTETFFEALHTASGR